ncbi:hypothetical protein B5F40_05310 [Gordonibacter sp. An230]|nr:hypothetical protein B5F40_05310 [Gordonibacter sp. An230]
MDLRQKRLNRLFFGEDLLLGEMRRRKAGTSASIRSVPLLAPTDPCETTARRRRKAERASESFRVEPALRASSHALALYPLDPPCARAIRTFSAHARESPLEDV